MKNKKWILILAAAFVVLLAGATVLYNQLKGDAPNQLVVYDNIEEGDGEVAEMEGISATPEPPVATETPVPTQAPQFIWNMPDFTVVDAAGNEVQLSSFIGKPIVLNFWASWCGPCKSEMPEFQEVYAQYGSEVQFLMVNLTGFGESQQTAMDYITSQGYTFPVYYDIWNSAAIAYGVTSIPATYFIDAYGNGVAHASGAINKDVILQGIGMIME